jgi:hypothetical protein
MTAKSKFYPIERCPIRATNLTVTLRDGAVSPDSRRENLAVIPNRTLGDGPTGSYGYGSAVTGTSYAATHPTVSDAIRRADAHKPQLRRSQRKALATHLAARNAWLNK